MFKSLYLCHSPHARHDLFVEAGRHLAPTPMMMPEARLLLLAAEDGPLGKGGREEESHSLVGQYH